MAGEVKELYAWVVDAPGQGIIGVDLPTLGKVPAVTGRLRIALNVFKPIIERDAQFMNPKPAGPIELRKYTTYEVMEVINGEPHSTKH